MDWLTHAIPLSLISQLEPPVTQWRIIVIL